MHRAVGIIVIVAVWVDRHAAVEERGHVVIQTHSRGFIDQVLAFGWDCDVGIEDWGHCGRVAENARAVVGDPFSGVGDAVADVDEVLAGFWCQNATFTELEEGIFESSKPNSADVDTRVSCSLDSFTVAV